jgi:hypothetical protein
MGYLECNKTIEIVSNCELNKGDRFRIIDDRNQQVIIETQFGNMLVTYELVEDGYFSFRSGL